MRWLSKPLADISWADVETFCQRRVTEGASLDYKEDFPKKLEKTIAAMANTLGGTILIGVPEDAEGKPMAPLPGIAFDRGLAEKVLSISAANIQPPVVPGVQVCTDITGQRAIVVIQVPQSRDAPHAIESNTQVYVRTGQRNDPDALANLDRIQWMLGNRRKAEDFRDWLIRRASARFDTVSGGEVPQIARSQGFALPRLNIPNAIALVPELPCLFTVLLVPTYPSAEPLILPAALQRDMRGIAVPDPMLTASTFPFVEIGSRLVEDGVIIHMGETERTYHTHLNIHGLYFHKQSMLYELENKSAGTKSLVIRSAEIMRRTRTMIDSGAKLYTLLNYFGPLHVRIRLERIIGHPLLITPSNGEQYIRYSTDHEIDAIELTSTAELTSNSLALTHWLVRRIGWAFNWDFSEAEIREGMKP
jgi:hypothetical protein